MVIGTHNNRIFVRRVPIWLRVFVALLILMNGVGVLGSVLNFQLAPGLAGLPVSPLPQVIFCGVFLLAFSALLIGLQQRRAAACTLAAPLISIYELVGLLWSLLLTRSTYSRETFGFDALLTLVILAPVWWTAWRQGWLERLRGALQLVTVRRP